MRAPLTIRLLLAASLGGAHGLAEISSQGPSEYQVKAAFLYNFAKFVEWPEQASGGRDGIVLCMFNQDPFRGALEQAAEGKTVNGHPLTIRRVSDVAAARACQVLFVSGPDSGRVAEITNAVQNSAVLTVSEIDRITEQGGIINFVMEDQKVRFQVNARAAARAGLKISSKLLQLAVASPEQGKK